MKTEQATIPYQNLNGLHFNDLDSFEKVIPGFNQKKIIRVAFSTEGVTIYWIT